MPYYFKKSILKGETIMMTILMYGLLRLEIDIMHARNMLFVRKCSQLKLKILSFRSQRQKLSKQTS